MHCQNCSSCGGAFHPATGHTWTPTLVLCRNCTHDFIAWLKDRHGKLSRLRKRDRGTTSFVDAAATSVHGS